MTGRDLVRDKTVPESGTCEMEWRGFSEAPGRTGVGMQMTRRVDGIFVVSGLPENGSAHRSGEVEVGDIICSVDGEPLEGQSMQFAASLICGPVGTQVNLTLLRGADLHHCAHFLDHALPDGGYARLLRISPFHLPW